MPKHFVSYADIGKSLLTRGWTHEAEYHCQAVDKAIVGMQHEKALLSMLAAIHAELKKLAMREDRERRRSKELMEERLRVAFRNWLTHQESRRGTCPRRLVWAFRRDIYGWCERQWKADWEEGTGDYRPDLRPDGLPPDCRNEPKSIQKIRAKWMKSRAKKPKAAD